MLLAILLLLGTTQGGIEIVNNIDVGNTTSYDFPDILQANRTFYVTIIPYNLVGDASGCIEESFRTGSSTLSDPPECTTLLSPLGTAVDVARDTDISWNATTNTDGYLISIGTTSGGSEIFTGDVGNVTSLNLTTDLPENSLVYVTITPYNAIGNATSCSEESFTTETLPNHSFMYNVNHTSQYGYYCTYGR